MGLPAGGGELLDARSGTLLQTIPVNELYGPLVPSPDHQYLAVPLGRSGDRWGAAVLPTDGGDDWEQLPKLPGTWIGAAWSPDGRLLAVGTPSGLVLYDVPERRLVQHAGHGGVGTRWPSTRRARGCSPAGRTRGFSVARWPRRAVEGPWRTIGMCAASGR